MVWSPLYNRKFKKLKYRNAYRFLKFNPENVKNWMTVAKMLFCLRKQQFLNFEPSFDLFKIKILQNRVHFNFSTF